MASDKRPRILVVGSMNMDLVLMADRIPAPGESYFGESYHSIPGGKGANQATAAARLGAAVTFCGRTGDDANGSRLVSSLEADHIDTSGITTDPEQPTGLAVIIVEPDGSNRIMVYAGANMQIQPGDVRDKLSGDYDAVMMNFEIPDDVVKEVTKTARKKSIPVIIDAGPARPFALEDIHGVEVLSPNETEVEALIGIRCSSESETRDAAKELRRRSGAKLVVIKLGERGSLAFDGTDFISQPAFEVHAVDTTAAGDAFTAGFTVSYIKTRDVAESLRFGAAAGAIAVTRLGAQPSLPTSEEAASFLAGHASH